jgi:oligosaccharide repeat unit polymerase
LWWLHPRFVVFYLGIPLLILAYLIPESAYVTLYRSRKYVDFDFLLVGLLIYTAFVAGSFLVIRTGTRSQEREALSYCRWVVWPLFILTMVGYVAWFASATVRAGGPGALLGALLELAFRPEVGMSDHVKFELFETIPGVTTLTQLGILYATVEALLWVLGGSRRRLALMRFAAVAGPTLVRAVLLSERLALLEIAVPIAVVLLSRARWTRMTRALIRLAPLLAGLTVFGLFTFAEYFRSWNFYRMFYPGPYLQFAAERFLGYYTTALNNAALYYHHGQVEPLSNTLTSVFEFPVLGARAKELYDTLFDIRSLAPDDMLQAYANPEFNNVPLVGETIIDFSIFFAPLCAFLLGAASFSLYKSFTRGRLLGLLLYPSWFIGLLEISRIYYWPGGRYFPVLAFLAVSLLLFKVAKATSPRSPSVKSRVPGGKRRREAAVYVGGGGV